MLESPLAACILFGGIEPAADIGLPAAVQALAKCRRVIAMTPFADPSIMKFAEILLPIGTFAETSGSYVNCEGRWQEFRGCAQPVGESRPGWKVLRVLANHLGLDGFSQESSAEVLAELRRAADGAVYDGRHAAGREFKAERRGTATTLPIYQVDPIVRRSTALQLTRAARTGTAGQG
jgi:NADH-quinone oxidoreductase subunit G